MSSSLTPDDRAELAELARLQSSIELVKMSQRSDAAAWRAAWRQRDRWDGRWERSFDALLRDHQRGVDINELARVGQQAWGVGFLRKQRDTPKADDVIDLLRLELKEPDLRGGAMDAYVGLAADESEDAGQFALDALGINETFAWANVRDFARDIFKVRGSKIIQRMHGTHVARLAAAVIQACDPRKPKTLQEIVAQIRRDWAGVTRSQARVIARTEGAHVWETTNFNALHLNGVEQVDWLTAVGPAIGTTTEPVCPDCLRRAAAGPYPTDDVGEIPPLHPQCRCTIVAVYDPTWLPPAEPWTGGERKLVIFR